MESYKEYLMHHGINGMKWGVRNGPPYPLSSSQKSLSEKKSVVFDQGVNLSAGRIVDRIVQLLEKEESDDSLTPNQIQAIYNEIDRLMKELNNSKNNDSIKSQVIKRAKE